MMHLHLDVLNAFRISIVTTKLYSFDPPSTVYQKYHLSRSTSLAMASTLYFAFLNQSCESNKLPAATIVLSSLVDQMIQHLASTIVQKDCFPGLGISICHCAFYLVGKVPALRHLPKCSAKKFGQSERQVFRLFLG